MAGEQVLPQTATIVMTSVHLPTAPQHCGLMARRTSHLSHTHLLNAFGNLQMSRQGRLSHSGPIIKAPRNCPPNVLCHRSIIWSMVPVKRKAAGLHRLRLHHLHIYHHGQRLNSLLAHPSNMISFHPLLINFHSQRLISILSGPGNLVPLHRLHIHLESQMHISILTHISSSCRLVARCLLPVSLRGRKERPMMRNFHHQ